MYILLSTDFAFQGSEYETKKCHRDIGCRAGIVLREWKVVEAAQKATSKVLVSSVKSVHGTSVTGFQMRL